MLVYFTLDVMNHLQYLYLQHHKLNFCHGKYIASTGKYSLNEIPLCFVTCNSVIVHVTYQDFLSNNANILRSNCTQIVQLDSVACPLAGFQIEYFAFPSSMEKSV